MDWSSIGKNIAKFAPTIGVLLGGPVGIAASAVGTLVASALGVDATPDAVASAIAMDPNAAAKIKEAEINAKVQLQQLLVQQEQQRMQFALQTYQAEASDRDSARKLAEAQPSDRTRQYITYIFLVGVLSSVIIILVGGADSLVKDATASLLIGTVIGYMFNELKQIMGFWFGATKSSADQQQTITNFAVSPGSVSGQTPTTRVTNTSTDRVGDLSTVTQTIKEQQ